MFQISKKRYSWLKFTQNGSYWSYSLKILVKIDNQVFRISTKIDSGWSSFKMYLEWLVWPIKGHILPLQHQNHSQCRPCIQYDSYDLQKVIYDSFDAKSHSKCKQKLKVSQVSLNFYLPLFNYVYPYLSANIILYLPIYSPLPRFSHVNLFGHICQMLAMLNLIGPFLPLFCTYLHRVICQYVPFYVIFTVVYPYLALSSLVFTYLCDKM